MTCASIFGTLLALSVNQYNIYFSVSIHQRRGSIHRNTLRNVANHSDILNLSILKMLFF